MRSEQFIDVYVIVNTQGRAINCTVFRLHSQFTVSISNNSIQHSNILTINHVKARTINILKGSIYGDIDISLPVENHLCVISNANIIAQNKYIIILPQEYISTTIETQLERNKLEYILYASLYFINSIILQCAASTHLVKIRTDILFKEKFAESNYFYTKNLIMFKLMYVSVILLVDTSQEITVGVFMANEQITISENSLRSSWPLSYICNSLSIDEYTMQIDTFNSSHNENELYTIQSEYNFNIEYDIASIIDDYIISYYVDILDAAYTTIRRMGNTNVNNESTAYLSDHDKNGINNILILLYQHRANWTTYGCGSDSTTIIFFDSSDADMFNTYQANKSKEFSFRLSHVKLSLFDNVVSGSIIFHDGNYDDIEFQNIVLNQECTLLNCWSLYMQSNNGCYDNKCSNLFENKNLESSVVASYYLFIELQDSCKVIIKNSTFYNNIEFSLFECLNAARSPFGTESQHNIKLSNSTFYLNNDENSDILYMYSDTYGNITFSDNSFHFDVTRDDNTISYINLECIFDDIPIMILTFIPSLMPTNESSVDPTNLPMATKLINDATTESIDIPSDTPTAFPSINSTSAPTTPSMSPTDASIDIHPITLAGSPSQQSTVASSIDTVDDIIKFQSFDSDDNDSYFVLYSNKAIVLKYNGISFCNEFDDTYFKFGDTYGFVNQVKVIWYYIGAPLNNSFNFSGNGWSDSESTSIQYNFIRENTNALILFNTFYNESTWNDLDDIETVGSYHELIVVNGYYQVFNTSIEYKFNDDGHQEVMNQHEIKMVTSGDDKKLDIIEKHFTESITKDKLCCIRVPFQGIHTDLENVNSDNSEYYQVATKTYGISYSITVSDGSEINIDIFMTMNIF